VGYIEDIDAPQFTASAVCVAAKIPMTTLKSWAGPRAAIPITSAARGRLTFSFRRVMQIAITADLVKLGFAARRAATLATGFTDVGDGAAGWNDEVLIRARRPGHLYPEGLTVLIANPASERAEVINISRNTSFMDALAAQPAPVESVAFINVNVVDRRVRESLASTSFRTDAA
jgi:hypothetical protein